MAHNSKIEWTEATWNPWHGCHKVSAGCKNCYMFRDKARYGQDPNVVVRSKTKFYDPLKWSEPRTIFTCSWSDFFIEEADTWRDEAFAIMALTPQHTYQVLTKRPERMWNYLYSFRKLPGRIADEAIRLRKERKITFPDAEFQTEPLGYGDPGAEWYPLKNVWLSVSVEDQKTADERIPLLLQTPAAVRWLSIEPLLGPIELRSKSIVKTCGANAISCACSSLEALEGRCDIHPTINWVVVGGESGPNARPMHPDWVRSIRDQCLAVCKYCAAFGAKYAVSTGPGFEDGATHWVSCQRPAFFFKQWGEWLPDDQSNPQNRRDPMIGETDMTWMKVGKKKAGRLLDGREWNEMPEVANAR